MYSSIDICQTIAKKLSQPQEVSESVYDSIRKKRFFSDKWQAQSLAYGNSGIATFYAVMDQVFLDEGWDRLAHLYLKIATEDFENNGFPNISLFTGLAGLGTATFFCSRKGMRYKQLAEKLDHTLIQEVQNILWKNLSETGNESAFVSPEIYNVAEGLSGILLYISLRKDNPYLISLGSDCIKQLSYLFKKKEVKLKYQVPGWFTLPDHYLPEQEKIYPDGCFLLSTPFGITGCLAAIAIAALEEFCPAEGYDLMRDIAQWLMQKQGHYASGVFWNHTISLNEELSGQLNPPQLNRDAWCYGIPSVSRALFLAAKALKDRSMLDFAEKSFLSQWSKTEKEWNLIGTSFGYGRAGHLAISQRMLVDTKTPVLKKYMEDLEHSLKKFYDPQSLFGFQAVSFTDNNEYIWVDDPGLLNGATGIALSLLNLHQNLDQSWERIFAIN